MNSPLVRYLLITFLYPLIYRVSLYFIRSLHPDHKLRQWYYLRFVIPIIQKTYQADKETIIFYCASLGEYETIKMVASQLRFTYNIQLMFFSSSGYEPMKNRKEEWDVLSYSPIDKKENIDKIIDTTLPYLVVISGNEIWPIFLKTLNQRGIPYLFLASTFQNKGMIHKIYNWLMSSYLKRAEIVYTHSRKTLKLLEEQNLKCSKIPNIRLASIHHDSTQKGITMPHSFLEFCKSKPTIIFGSVYESEISELVTRQKSIIEHYQIIIAPHEIKPVEIDSIKSRFSNSISWSNLDKLSGHNTLIINEIGILKHLYKHCTFCYVGGGFHKGVHNVFEAAIHSKPIVIGPMYQKFEDVSELVKKGHIHVAKSTAEIFSVLDECINPKREDNTFEYDANQTDQAITQIVQHIITLSNK